MIRCSIITCVYNQLPLTKLFIESVRRHTLLPYELIVVNNGSTDGTKEYLQELSDVTVIENAENYGVSKGWNQGVQIAKAPYVCICNNDVVVTKGWLESLLLEMERDNQLGLVSPVENTYMWGHPQNFPDESIVHRSGEPIGWSLPELDRFYGGLSQFAESFTGRNCDLRIFDIHFSVVVIRKSLFDSVGAFEEGFGKAFWEDVDFVQRALIASCWNKVEIYGGAYVHHFGNATSREFGYPQLIDSGKAFTRKWGSIGDKIYQDLKLHQLDQQRIEKWRNIWRGEKA